MFFKTLLPDEPKFHIIQKRKIWYIISAAIILPGLISLFIQGLNLGIDFTGGNIFEVRIDKADISEVREVIRGQGLTERYVQESGGKVFLIRTESLDEQQTDALLKAFEEKFGSIEVLRIDKIGPVISVELIQKAVMSLVIASVLIVIYVSIRFEFTKGVAAIIALLHDMIVVLGIASILQLEVNTAFVAAMLTIIGYSINDTIVIFDRVRENMSIKKGMRLADIINLSLWETMARSINTTLTVLFVLIPMYLFGGVTLRDFVLTLIIGVLIGAYSSIFHAAPVWYDMIGDRRKKRIVQQEA